MDSNEMSNGENNTGDTGELLELSKSLITAASVGDTVTVFELMKFGAPFATDWLGLTSLHHAALGGHLSTCELLVKSGILRDARSKVEKTPLHLACQEGHAQVAMFLIANEADVNAVDMLLMTPLHWAVEMNHIKTAQVLLQNGADPSLLNKFDKTCFDIAAEHNNHDIIALLEVGPHYGKHTMSLQERSKISDFMKKKLTTSQQNMKNIAKKPQEATKIIIMSPPQQKKKNTGQPIKRTIHDKDEIQQLLEEHSIEMLEGEEINLVASAVGSGQTVILTEAGKQALTLTDSVKNPTPSSSSLAKSRPQPSAPTIATKQEENILEMVAAVSQKYHQAKRELYQYKMLYAKKKREVAEYQNKLQMITLKSLHQSGDIDVQFMEEAVEASDDDDINRDEFIEIEYDS